MQAYAASVREQVVLSLVDQPDVVVAVSVYSAVVVARIKGEMLFMAMPDTSDAGVVSRALTVCLAPRLGRRDKGLFRDVAESLFGAAARGLLALDDLALDVSEAVEALISRRRCGPGTRRRGRGHRPSPFRR